MKLKIKIETPIEYMEELNWDLNALNIVKDFFKKEESVAKSLYKSLPKNAINRMHFVELEHLRNCINYWDKKLNSGKIDENQ